MILKNICPDNECTGCMACVNVCAHSAIIKVTDELGFAFPRIDTEKCKECGLCYKVCPQLTLQKLYNPKDCFAAAIADKTEILACSSGGLCTAFSRHIIRQGGIVVGCSGTRMDNVKHVIVSSEEHLKELSGSKYVQSQITDTLYREIRKELQDQRRVLFIGTGCQVAALKSFLGKTYENLLTIDLICHGVPSQKMLNENIGMYGDIDISTVKFRKKIVQQEGSHAIRFGWYYSDKMGKSFYTPWHKDSYLSSFMSGINFRRCCYSCKYAQPQRVGDVTLGDFWGLGSDSQLNVKFGVSLLLVNSKKGLSLIDSIKDSLIMEKRPLQEAVVGNAQLQHPTKLPHSRQKFERLYTKNGLKSAARRTVMCRMLCHRIFTTLKTRFRL